MVSPFQSMASFRKSLAKARRGIAWGVVASCALWIGGACSNKHPIPPSENAASPVGNDLIAQSPHLAFGGSEDQIFFVNFQSIRRLSIYEKARDGILDNPDRKKWMGDLIKDLGMNPLEKIDKVAVGFREPLDLDDPLKNAVVLFVGQFENPPLLVDGFQKFLAQHYLTNPPPFVVSDHQGVSVYSLEHATMTTDAGKTADYHLAFPKSNILLLARNKDHLTQTLDVIAKRAPNLTTNANWQPRLGQIKLGSISWGAGLFSPAVNKFIQQHAEKEPELAGLRHLTKGKEFYFSLTFDLKEYLLSGGVVCDEIRNSRAMRDDLDVARSKGIVKKIMTHYLGDNNPATPVWDKFLGGTLLSANAATLNVDLRKSKQEAEDFVRDAINPPPPTAKTESGVAQPFK